MERRPRSAQKRRAHVTPSDDSGSEISAQGDEDWTLSSGGSHTARSDTSSQVDTHSRSDAAAGSSSEGSDLVVAPPLEQTRFDSWEELHAYLDDYMQHSYQSFRIRTNNKVEERNKKIKAAGSRAPEIPLEWGFYNKTLVCTHGGAFKSRSKGKRPRQETRRIKCNAQINACVRVVNRRADDPVFGLCITVAKLHHNHPLNKMTYNQYSSVRTSIPRAVVDTVNVLRKAGAKKKSILQYILDNSDRHMTMRDVHNLVVSLKARDQGSTTSAQRLKKWMVEFCEEQGNIGRIFVEKQNEKNIATCIYLQTKHMRELFHRFPEVMLIDATHGTNASKYKVFSFMVHDAFGKGQFVQHSIMQNEKAATLLNTCSNFGLSSSFIGMLTVTTYFERADNHLCG